MTDEVIHLSRTPLTRNIEATFPDVHDEMIAAFSDHIPVRRGKHFLPFFKNFRTDEAQNGSRSRPTQL